MVSGNSQRARRLAHGSSARAAASALARRWSARGGPGKHLGSFPRADRWIYGTGGIPTAFAISDGRAVPLMRPRGGRFFGLDGATGAGRLALLSQNGLLAVYALRP